MASLKPGGCFGQFIADVGVDLGAQNTQLRITPAELVAAIADASMTDRIIARVLYSRGKAHEAILDQLISAAARPEPAHAQESALTPDDANGGGDGSIQDAQEQQEERP